MLSKDRSGPVTRPFADEVDLHQRFDVETLAWTEDLAMASGTSDGRAVQLRVNKIRAALRRCAATPAACIRQLANMPGLAGGFARAPITDLAAADKQILQEMVAAVGIEPVGQTQWTSTGVRCGISHTR